MESLNTPLNKEELKKIDKFFYSNRHKISSKKMYKNLDSFIQQTPEFKNLISNLSKAEKTKAWMYLYDLRNNQPTIKKNNKNLIIGITVSILVLLSLAGYLYLSNSKAEKPKSSEIKAITQQQTDVAEQQSPSSGHLQVSSKSETMNFDECRIKVSQVTAMTVGTQYKSKLLIDTPQVYMTRVCTNDGSVILTCTQAEQKMTVTKSSDCPL